VRDRLAAQGISAAVNWRVKRPYRAHVETRQSGMGVADLHDLFAFRVLVASDLECYRALGCIHQIWHPMEDRIRDYIATPKVNGYRSLHTAVYGLDERRVQFHIRTHRMHRQVQHGVAAHWLERAARGQPADSAVHLALEDLPGWVAQLDYWHRELRLTAAEFVDALVRELFEDQVFAFTPKGDVVDLPRDSTTLDFAYRIHTALGDHCAGARVQAAGPGGAPVVRVVPVGYRIQSGDVITVLTQPAVAVRPAWLDLVRTRGARERVLRALRALASEQDEAALPEPSAESEPQLVQPILHPSGEPAVLDLARCCYPCPDDAIVGLAGRAQRVIVHRSCCRTLRRAISRRQRLGRPGATLPLDWRSVPDMAFRMAISVHGQDHRGLMFELASCMKALDINLTATYATAIQDRHKAVVTLICEFPWTGRPEDTLRRLRAIPGVTRVERDLTLGCADPGVEA
jgi:(p)ppGpp synthase/HD superfamily hydrolase